MFQINNKKLTIRSNGFGLCVPMSDEMLPHVIKSRPTPMSPVRTKPGNPLNLELAQCIFEEGLVGERVLALAISNCEQRYFTDRLQRKNCKFPIRLRENVHSCIFDGEIVQVDALTNAIVSNSKGANVVTRYRIFDIQMFNGCNVMHRDLISRKRLLNYAVRRSATVDIVPFENCKDMDVVMRALKSSAHGYLIVKNIVDVYTPNKRSWHKISEKKVNDI